MGGRGDPPHRQLVALTDEPEVAGLLALMLLHHARRASRTGPGGRLVPLREQDRSRWDTGLIAEGVAILQAALAATGWANTRHRPRSPPCTRTLGAPPDGLGADRGVVRRTAAPHRQPGGAAQPRAVAVGEADGPQVGLAALADVTRPAPLRRGDGIPTRTRGDLAHAAELYAEASRAATSVPERDHLAREAARVRQRLRP